MVKLWSAVLAVFVIFGLLTGYNFFKSDDKTVLIQPLVSQSTPKPTPFPFEDMTIPYLRAREYNSNLEELQKTSENSNYVSYLTKYDSDGLKINGQLTKPTGQMPEGGFAAIIFIHGYIPPKNYQTLVSYSSYVDYLAINGFVIFKIDLRGHGNSEGEGGGAYFSSDYIIDTLNAYKALEKSDFVNPKKIGLFGHSMAGNVILRSLAARPDIPAAVIWAGAVYSYVDFTEYGIDDNSYQPPQVETDRVRKRREMLNLYGMPTKKSEFWQKVAPTNYLNDLKGAIQLNHALDDNVVDISYSRNLNSMLNSTSVVHELNEFPSGGHNMTGDTFNQAMQKTIEFFRKNL